MRMRSFHPTAGKHDLLFSLSFLRIKQATAPPRLRFFTPRASMSEPDTEDARDDPLPPHPADDPHGLTLHMAPNHQPQARLNAASVFVEDRRLLVRWLRDYDLSLGAVMRPTPLTLGRALDASQGNSGYVFGAVWPLTRSRRGLGAGRGIFMNCGFASVTTENVGWLLWNFIHYLDTGDLPGNTTRKGHSTWQSIVRNRRLKPRVSFALAWWDDPRVPATPVRICLTLRPSTDAEVALARGRPGVLYCGDADGTGDEQ